MNATTRAAIGRALGSAITACAPRGGGDINEAFQVTLDDGRRIFAKLNDRAPPGFFESEERGLRWLAAPGVIDVPEVLGVGNGAGGTSPFLLLEWIEPATRAPDFDERLGQALAALHRSGAPSFGLDHDNFIAVLPQDNRSERTWAAFYRERRLLPLFERARQRGHWDAALDSARDALLSRLDRLTGPDEPPARLHGDLWSGNLHAGAGGQPVLIDPAVYAGHREIDLAMMRLFGGFGRRVFDAYAASYPLAPDHHERVALYQLYPLLVHLCTFGTGYLGQVASSLERYR